MKALTTTSVAVALAVAGLVGNAHALVLDQGSGTVVAPSTGATGDLGTLLEFVSTDVATATFAGEARAAVYDGPEVGVNLDFYYQFTSDGGSGDAIAMISAGGFSGTSVDVFQYSGPWGSFVEGTAPAGTVELSSGGTVAFNFEPSSVSSGTTTSILQVRTGATSFVESLMGVIDGTTTFAQAFAPVLGGGLPPVTGGGEPPFTGGGEPSVPEIPEPETYALMLAGLGMLGIVGKRRSRRNDDDVRAA